MSRSLSSSPGNFHVLALDSSESQTAGSISRQDWLSPPSNEPGQDEPASGSLTHRTIHISDAESLAKAINNWILEKGSAHSDSHESPVPVVLVGLHCCGDLTPSILHFIERMKGGPREIFEVVGCVIVGCCYNMCTPNGMFSSRFTNMY